MGFLSILKKMRAKEKEMRILILGLDNAGKTTILKRLNGQDVAGTSPTLGFNIETLVYNDYALNLWDVGGQSSLRSYWRNYFEATDGLIWVVDCSDRMRMSDCAAELEKLLMEERLLGASLLVLANKQDLAGGATLEELQRLLQLDKIHSHHYHLAPCSAYTGENLLEALHWLVQDISSRLFFPD